MNELKRIHPRLKNYDYSQPGCYFITICTYGRKCVLSRIISVGRPLAAAEIHLTAAGKLAENNLLSLESRYSSVRIEKYAIMPNHIHALISLLPEDAGASARPTIPGVIRAFKSNCVRQWNQMPASSGTKLFQTSYYDHIVRNQNDYDEIWTYIDNNPLQWELDTLYKK